MTSSHAPDVQPEKNRYRFPKSFRLKRRRLIRALFDRRRSDVYTKAGGCIRILYRVVPRSEVGKDVPVQTGFSAGRKAGTAVTRNRITRIMREVYRVNQTDLIDLFYDRDETLTMMVLFRGDAGRAEHCIPNDLPRLLERIYHHLGEVY